MEKTTTLTVAAVWWITPLTTADQNFSPAKIPRLLINRAIDKVL